MPSFGELTPNPERIARSTRPPAPDPQPRVPSPEPRLSRRSRPAGRSAKAEAPSPYSLVSIS